MLEVTFNRIFSEDNYFKTSLLTTQIKFGNGIKQHTCPTFYMKISSRSFIQSPVEELEDHHERGINRGQDDS